MGCGRRGNCRRLRALICGRRIFAGPTRSSEGVPGQMRQPQCSIGGGPFVADVREGPVPSGMPVFLKEVRMPHNMSANTDPQQQVAASPQMLVVRLPLR
jgi:hypothetical protein